MNAVLTLESSLEFDACFHLEYSPAAKAFESQPEGFYYEFDSRPCPYTPDFRVTEQDDSRYYAEIKPSELVTRPDFFYSAFPSYKKQP